MTGRMPMNDLLDPLGRHSFSGPATEFEPRAIHLCKGAVTSFRLHPGEAVAIRAVTGLLWISQEGDPEDYFVSADRSVCLAKPGLVVLEGLAEKNEWVRE